MTKEKNPNAVKLGQLGGQKTSDAKKRAAVENAKKPRPNRKKKTVLFTGAIYTKYETNQ